MKAGIYLTIVYAACMRDTHLDLQKQEDKPWRARANLCCGKDDNSL